MLNLCKPVQTRSGHSVDIFPNRIEGKYSVVGVVHRLESSFREDQYSHTVHQWTPVGEVYGCSGEAHEFQLVNVPEKTEGYVAMYEDKSSGRLHLGPIWDTWEEAMPPLPVKNPHFVGVKLIRWEE